MDTLVNRRVGWIASLLVLGALFGWIGGCSADLPTCQQDSDCGSAKFRCSAGTCQAVGLDGGVIRDGVLKDGETQKCATGQRRSCYTGDIQTRSRGECRSGEELCIGGKWDECVGQKLPSGEKCDGKDNDCNGLVDDHPNCGGACTAGTSRACYTGAPTTIGKGPCKAGVQTCLASGKWSTTCTGQVLPAAETCDKIDNDCDGQIDNGVCSSTCKPAATRACYTGAPTTLGKGACKAGVQTCLSTGQWSAACVGQILPAAEICDKLDNDCNGQIDDGGACGPKCDVGVIRNCYEGPAGTRGHGICQAGIQTCLADGTWSKECKGQVLPQKEVCDKQDNDCDRLVDEGVCANGCVAGTVRNCYEGPAGTRGHGVCKAGIQTCLANGQWSSTCAGQVLPSAEVCDKLDNDCNRVVDDGAVCGGCIPGTRSSCYTGPIGTLNVGSCRAGSRLCAANRTWGACTGQVLPTEEKCNGLDDDCDKYVDEAFPEQNNACKTGIPGICSDGLYGCVKGKLTCLQLRQPGIEICNGKDDDCNGKIDDGSNQRTFYRDADNDGYGNPRSAVSACLQPTGYVSNNQDCYDGNPSARPGQFAFFTTHRGDGSFDYNCDNVESKRFNAAGSCLGCQSPVFDQGFDGGVPVCGKSGNWITACRFDVGKCYPLTSPKLQECR